MTAGHRGAQTVCKSPRQSQARTDARDARAGGGSLHLDRNSPHASPTGRSDRPQDVCQRLEPPTQQRAQRRQTGQMDTFCRTHRARP